MPQHISTSGAGGIIFFHYIQTATFGVHSLHPTQPHQPRDWLSALCFLSMPACGESRDIVIDCYEGQSASWVTTVT